MNSSNGRETSGDFFGGTDPKNWQEFQILASDVERADREGTLDACRELVGTEIVDRLLVGDTIDAEIQHLDPKRRSVAICIAMYFHELTEQIVDKCVCLARADEDKDVRYQAIRLLGRTEGKLTEKAVGLLLELIFSDKEDEEIRLSAYRSLIYVSGALSTVRPPGDLARSVRDIDWEFVNKKKSGRD